MINMDLVNQIRDTTKILSKNRISFSQYFDVKSHYFVLSTVATTIYNPNNFVDKLQLSQGFQMMCADVEDAILNLDIVDDTDVVSELSLYKNNMQTVMGQIL